MNTWLNHFLLHLELAKQRRLWEGELKQAAAYRELECFSYSVSHDLRTPLRVVDGFAQILGEDFSAALGDEGRRLVDKIRGGSQEMGKLIEGLLEFYKAGRGEIHWHDTDCQALANAAVHEAKLVHVGPSPLFELSELPRVDGDAILLCQVWCNLIGNVVKYSAKQTFPRVKVSGHEVLYQVEDNGAGFDMRYADKLFGVFSACIHHRISPALGLVLR